MNSLFINLFVWIDNDLPDSTDLESSSIPLRYVLEAYEKGFNAMAIGEGIIRSKTSIYGGEGGIRTRVRILS